MDEGLILGITRSCCNTVAEALISEREGREDISFYNLISTKINIHVLKVSQVKTHTSKNYRDLGTVNVCGFFV